MFGLSTFELLVILLIVLLVFGAGKLPKVMGDLGRGVQAFKKSLDGREEVDAATSSPSAVDAAKPRTVDAVDVRAELKAELK
jgi:sec-independent protein translocase protein TatA